MDDADEEQTPLLRARIKLLKSKVRRPGKCFWCNCIFSSCCAAIVALIVSLSIYSVEKSSTSVDEFDPDYMYYQPGDTLIYGNFSTFYCQGLSVGGASLYLVPETPPLTVSASKAVNYSTSVDISSSEETTEQYLLHANSTITVEACVLTSQVADENETYVFIIKGDANYSCYHDDVYFYDNFPGYYIAKVTVTSLCYKGNTTLKFAVEESDNYYISMFNNNHNDDDPDVNGNIGWSIVRTEYSIDDFSQPLANCTSDSTDSPCTLFVPFLTSDKVLFAVPGVTTPHDYNALPTSVNCVLGPGAFIILALLAFTATVCVCFVFICICNWFLFKKKKPYQYGPIGGTQSYGRYPPPDPVSVNNYNRASINNRNPAPVNYYPQPNPVNNYPPPNLAPVNNYPPPNPAPVNNYPPPNPAPVNNYPPPDPAPVNNYPRPQPITANNYPRPDPNISNLPPPQQLPNYPRPSSTNYPRPDPVFMDNYPPPYSS